MKSAKARDDDGAGGSGSSDSESSGKSTPRNGNGDESDSTDKASPVDFAELIAKFAPVADFFGLGNELWSTDDPVATLARLHAVMS
mgnify:CR=1 FL=1